jgi:hypothetical protein
MSSIFLRHHATSGLSVSTTSRGQEEEEEEAGEEDEAVESMGGTLQNCPSLCR